MGFFSRQDDARRRTRRLVWAFALTVLLLVLVLNVALTLFMALVPIARAEPLIFYGANTGFILLYVLGGWWIERGNLSFGGVHLAQRAGARPARRGDEAGEQRFCNVVDELAIAADMKPPAPMVLPRTEAINAFAAAWGEDDAVVVVTQGALERLTREELQGLVAHELSHIREGDARLNMDLSGMVWGLQVMRDLGLALIGGFGTSDELGRRLVYSRGLAAPYAFGVLLGIPLLIAGWPSWLAGEVLKAAVSRQREYLADARAVQWTRSRDGIGGVLRKILYQQGELARQPRQDWRDAKGMADVESVEVESPVTWSASVQHMLLVDSDPEGRWFDSHPPLQERIRRIYGQLVQPLPN